jgi:hypothetical protein
MSTSPNANPLSQAKKIASLQKLITGLTKHDPTLTPLIIGGKTYKTADLITTLQSLVNAANAVVTTRASWQNAVKANHDQQAQTKGLVSGLRQALLVAFAGSIDNLSDFGLVPHKAPVVSPETKVAAAKKSLATRAARHTLGKKQKAAIKGTVTPAVASGAPAPVAAPTAASPPPPTPPKPAG